MILLEAAPTEFEWIPNSLHGILEMLAFISLIIGGASVFFLWKTDRLAKATSEFQVVNQCMSTYTSLSYRLSEIENIDTTSDEGRAKFKRLLTKYLFLTQQEIEHIRSGLISDGIAKAWISGMIETLYRFSEHEAIIYQAVIVEIHANTISKVFDDKILNSDPQDEIIVSSVLNKIKE